MKRIAATVLALILSLSLFSCSSEKAGGLRTEKGEIYPDPFLVFDGKKVPFYEFRYYYMNYRDMYLAENPDAFSEEGRQEEFKNEILQCLLDQYALTAMAKEAGISLDRDEKASVKAQIEEAKAPFENQKAFLESLHASYMTEKHFEMMMENAALSDKLFQTLFGEEGSEIFTDEEFYEYYEDHYFAVQQIFIPYEKGEKLSSCEKTVEKAQEIRKSTLEGKDFWDLVKEFGKDDRMLEHPDGYYFTKGQCEDVLYEATTQLEIGEISGVVKGSTGVYLLRRMEMKRERMEENRAVALYGYDDGTGSRVPGAYDDLFLEMIRERAEKIEVKYGKEWDLVSTESMF